MTQEELKQLIHYDPLTGLVTRLSTGRVSGTLSSSGHLMIRLGGKDRKSYLLHRLIWLYMTGSWPLDQVDHQDRDKTNNRWTNLQESNHLSNSWNVGIKSTNTSGYTGVSLHPSGKWQAKIRISGKQQFLGLFKDKESARDAYLKADGKRRQ